MNISFRRFLPALLTVAAMLFSATLSATPTISITSPSTGSTVAVATNPPSVTISATAAIGSSPVGTQVSSVNFFANGTSIGTVGGGAFGNYSITWFPTSTGTFTLTATVTDTSVVTTGTTPNLNTATSPLVVVTLTGFGPSVVLNTPAAGAALGLGSNVSLTATPTAGGNAISRVDFLAGATVVGSAFTAPYAVQWTPAAAGSVNLTARVSDVAGFSAVSPAVNVSITVPTVALTSPQTGAGVVLGVATTLSATAIAVSPATVDRVEFLAGSTLVGTDTSAPYSTTWTPTAAGNVVLTARVTDSNGAVITSAAANVTVATAVPSVTLSSPASGATLNVNAAVSLEATATAGSGTVNRVDFFAGGTTPIGTVLSPPYVFQWTPTTTGVVGLTARVTDSNATQVTSSTVNVTVVGPSIVMTSPQNNAGVILGLTTTLVATPVAVSPASVTKVEFLAGTTLIGTATSAPYSVAWTPTAAGNVVLTARVTDSNGAALTSSAVNVTVTTALPTVALLSPSSGASLNINAPVSVEAIASSIIGTVTRVDFFAGTTPIGTVLSAPYVVSWTPTATGVVALTARVTDSNASQVTSSTVNVTVVGPSVALTSPQNNAGLILGVPTTLNATATAASSATVTKVEFLAGSTLVGTDTSAPYSVTWTPTAAGNVVLTARATDSNGAAITSSAVTVAVATTVPTVALIRPSSAATLDLNAPVTLEASAAVSSGTVTRVDFIAGGTTVGTVLSPPYVTSWTPTTTGVVALTARVTDSNATQVTSSIVNVTVVGPTVAITNPTAGATIPTRTAISLTANATSGGSATVNKVDFFSGGTLLGTATSAPFTFSWTPTTSGNVTLTARVTDSNGATFTSAAVAATLVDTPTVTVTAPLTGAEFSAGLSVNVSATATAGTNNTVSRVEFFADGVLFATDTTSPFSGVWTVGPNRAAAYALTARVVDSSGANVMSAPVLVTSVDTSAPNIVLSISPGVSTVPSGATRNILATVTPAVGRATERVEFFIGGTKVGERASQPFNFRYTAPSTPGEYLFTAVASDNAGRSKTAEMIITVVEPVGQPPIVTVLSPLSGTVVVPNLALTVSASAIANGGTIAGVQFYANGNPFGATITAPPYLSTFTPGAPGSYAIDAIATDDRGNSRVSNSAFITAAFSTPSIAFLAPVNGARATPNVPITLSVSAQGGNGAAVLLVEFLVDGAVVGARTAPTATGGSTFTFPWTPSLVNLGARALTARVTDANSQTTLSNSLTVNVANVVGTPPTVTIVSPTVAAANSLQSQSLVNFTANAFASGAGNSLSVVEFFLNDVSIGTGTREQTTNLYRLAFNFADFGFAAITPDANGRYPVSLYAIARDANGNQTISSTTNLGINPSTSAPPSVQLLTQGLPTITQGTPYIMLAIPTDGDGIVTSLQLFSNGVASGAAIANPGPQVILTFNPVAAGRFNLFVVATDDTGNTAISTPTVVLTVAAVNAPVTSVVRPANDATVTTVNTPVFLEATATSADSPTLTVTFIATATSGARTVVNATQVTGTTTYRAVWTPTVASNFTITSSAAVPLTTITGTSGNSRRVAVTTLVGLAPTVSVAAPGTTTTASTANFTATANDSDGSVVGVEFFVNRNSIGQAVRDQLTNTWRLTAAFAGLPLGNAEVVAIVRDSTGNLAASATTNVFVVAAASTPPTVTISPSTRNVPFSRQVQLTANARDIDGTINSVQYFANGGNLGTSGNAGTNYLVNWTPNQSGTFNVWGVATDNTGNTTVAATVQVLVRPNNPVLEDAAFILQTYQDIANTATINPLVFADLDARLTAGTMQRSELVSSLIDEPGFVAPVQLLTAYYVLMGHWPTPANYASLLATARGSMTNAIGAILAANEYFAKYGTVPTVGLLNNPNSAIPVRTFLAQLHANAGLGAPTDVDLVRFMNNNTTFGNTLGRGYNVVGLNTALLEFVNNTNAPNTTLAKRALAAALYYQLDRPPVTVTTDQIEARVTALAQLSTTTAIVQAVLDDVLYTYRYVTILQQPVSLTVAPRSGALFSVNALGAPPLSYQWLLNGAPVTGATSSQLSLTNVDASKVGNYTVVVTSDAGVSATSDVASLALSTAPTRLGNIATRGATGGGADVLIAGFVVSGTGQRPMLIRAVGPTLAGAPFGVTGTLANPRLEVHASGVAAPILTNDDWGNQQGGAVAVTAIQQAATRVSAFPLPNGSLDAALLANLTPGNYTVQVRGAVPTAVGVALIEVYDASPVTTAGPRAINVSTRGNVGTGANILIAGFVVNGTVARRTLIRGVGPTLSRFGLPAASLLADPQITLSDQVTGLVLKTNDDWSTSAEDAGLLASAANSSAVVAFPLNPGSKDAAMLVMLPPGPYTVQLRGANNGTGIAIVEVYDVDP